MATKTIYDYSTAVSIDPATHWILIQPGTNSVDYNKINRETLLNITGDPVGTTDIQSLTNKTIGNTNTITLKDTLFTLQDDSDTTKQAKFQLSGITTATTRTYTLPDASSTLADIATAQTLTNKTLTAPVITGGTITNSTISVDSISEYTAANGVTIDGMNIKDGKLNTNNSVVNANVTDSAITPAKLLAGTGSGWTWQTWTPTFTNISGGTLNYAAYIQIGKTVFCRLKYTLAGAGMSTDPYFTLPVSANGNYASSVTGETYMGTVSLVDTGVDYYAGVVMERSSTTALLRYISSAGKYIGITSTLPFTWNNTDFIQVNFSYEAA